MDSQVPMKQKRGRGRPRKDTSAVRANEKTNSRRSLITPENNQNFEKRQVQKIIVVAERDQTPDAAMGSTTPT